jgi:hypothetical protein
MPPQNEAKLLVILCGGPEGDHAGSGPFLSTEPFHHPPDVRLFGFAQLLAAAEYGKQKCQIASRLMKYRIILNWSLRIHGVLYVLSTYSISTCCQTRWSSMVIFKASSPNSFGPWPRFALPPALQSFFLRRKTASPQELLISAGRKRFEFPFPMDIHAGS